MKLQEQHIYGSARLGVVKQDLEMIGSVDPSDVGEFDRVRGMKRYELANHLGNVLTVISDRKMATVDNGVNVYYHAEIISYSDYYPFGAPMSQGTTDRTWSVEEYRFGFNGKEQVDEMIGESNGYDFGARMYDARLGRWWSVDKMYFLEFSSSVYSYCGNSPIIYIDNGGNFRIRNNVPQNKQTANTQLAITRITNISASLGYLLSLTREVTLTDGTKSTQTILEYIMKDSGLSKAEIYKQISSGTGAVLEIGENAGVPAQTPSSNLIILDIDAIDALGNPNLSNDELADLSFFWGVTILHELCHLGDRITNKGQQSGQPGMPDGKQAFKRAQEPTYHRGQSMELEFFGSTFANSLEAHTDPQTNEVIPAGMDYGDLSFEKEKVGLTNSKILSESNVTSTTPVRRTYAEF